MAIAKIQAEIDANKDNAYIQVVGGFLLQHLAANPQDAEKIINPDKTIAKSLGEMRKEAEKKKIGNCAVLTPSEGFGLVLKYFGIDEKQMSIQSQYPLVGQEPLIKQEKTDDMAFNISLDDLLG